MVRVNDVLSMTLEIATTKKPHAKFLPVAPVVPPTSSFYLLETGTDKLLMESGDKYVIE